VLSFSPISRPRFYLPPSSPELVGLERKRKTISMNITFPYLKFLIRIIPTVSAVLVENVYLQNTLTRSVKLPRAMASSFILMELAFLTPLW